MEFLQKIGTNTFQFLFTMMIGIHQHVVSTALFFDISLFTVYLSLWIICGLLSVVIYKYLTEGPANPFGEDVEREMFWYFTLLGLVGLLIAIKETIWYFFEMRKYRKEVLEEPTAVIEEDLEKIRNFM